jgi:hypothetical protein
MEGHILNVTLHEALARHGIASDKPPYFNIKTEGKRRLYFMASLEEIGYSDAKEAWELIHKLEGMRCIQRRGLSGSTIPRQCRRISRNP